jgi:phosphotransferase system enzyme I (PtsI)
MVLTGNAISPGIAIGKLFEYAPFHVELSEKFCAPEEAKNELNHFLEAKKQAAGELDAIYRLLEIDDPEKAKIFIAHKDILDDEAIVEEIIEGINGENWAGDWAIYKIFGKFARLMQRAPDPLIRERAADFEDVRKRLLRVWYGERESNLAALSEPVIVAAHDLLPSDTATLDRNKVLAILTEVGGATSHSAIIARSYEIPAILGVQGLLDTVRSGMNVAVDATSGEIVLEPAPDLIKSYVRKREEFLKQRAETKAFLDTEPLTADKVKIDIGLNIGDANDSELEGEKYTDLVGLFRTEFLYMGRDSLPTEDEQLGIYKKVLERYGTRPVTLRTLDIGGDKTLQCMKLPKEDNPFLGNRALRLCFTYPDIFKTQLRAALRASVFGNLWLMLPMVSCIDDVRRAKKLIAEARDELNSEGIAYNPDMKTGIMIEIPAIALISDLVVGEVDFASIGTNDLCQYLTACDRMNPTVASFYQTYHPALFRIIEYVVKTFNKAGKPVCVCGEMGGDALAAPVLVGLGMRKLSMGLASVARMKRVLSKLTIADTEKLAASALNLPTAQEVEIYLRENLPN